jgi:hypothetical protein
MWGGIDGSYSIYADGSGQQRFWYTTKSLVAAMLYLKRLRSKGVRTPQFAFQRIKKDLGIPYNKITLRKSEK